MTKTLQRYGLRVVLDRSKVVEGDPGADTPAMVYGRPGFSSTLWCAIGTGELDSYRDGDQRLTDRQHEWLESIEGEANTFLYGET